MDEIKAGIYQHFKGNLYQVLFTAKHSETLEEMVIYKALYGSGEIWARPKYMWTQMVEYNNTQVLRFKFVKE